MNLGKSIYTFDESNKKLLTSVSSNPQYQNIKNDFVVWGNTKTASGADKPIRYHLVFDKKPDLKTEPRLCLVYTDYRGLQQVIILKTEGENANCKIGESIPENDTEDKDAKKYYYLTEQGGIYHVTYWDEERTMFRVFSEYEVCYLQTDDWRTELYFLGLENPNKAFTKNYYAAELNAEWPKIYDIKNSAPKSISKQNDNLETDWRGSSEKGNSEKNYVLVEKTGFNAIKATVKSEDDYKLTFHPRVYTNLKLALDFDTEYTIYLEYKMNRPATESQLWVSLTQILPDGSEPKSLSEGCKTSSYSEDWKPYFSGFKTRARAEDETEEKLYNMDAYFYIVNAGTGDTFPSGYELSKNSLEIRKLKIFKGNVEIKTNEEYPFVFIYDGGYRNDLAIQNYEYWLDFLEGSQGGSESVSQFSVNNIGRRVTIGKDKTANCIFSYEFPNFIIYPVGQENYGGDSAIQVKKELYDKMTLGGGQVSAFDKAKELLVQHTQYNEAVTIATIPIYYLEPNTIIHIEDNDVSVNGDYIINTISLPLTIGTSNISCTRCLSKTI